MPHNSLPSTPPAVSAKSAASDVLASLDTQAFLAQLLAQQTPFGELAVVSSFGWDPLESTCRHASLSIL